MNKWRNKERERKTFLFFNEMKYLFTREEERKRRRKEREKERERGWERKNKSNHDCVGSRYFFFPPLTLSSSFSTSDSFFFLFFSFSLRLLLRLPIRSLGQDGKKPSLFFLFLEISKADLRESMSGIS